MLASKLGAYDKKVEEKEQDSAAEASNENKEEEEIVKESTNFGIAENLSWMSLEKRDEPYEPDGEMPFLLDEVLFYDYVVS